MSAGGEPTNGGGPVEGFKLIVAIVQGGDAEGLIDALASRGFAVTKIDSAGGFLRERNATLLVGVQEAYAGEVLRILRERCHSRSRFVNPLMPVAEPGESVIPGPVTVEVGGATVFVLDVERYERIA